MASLSTTLDDKLGGYEWHIMDSGASVGQHQHEGYALQDSKMKNIEVTVANGAKMVNKSSGRSAYMDKNGTILDTTNTTDYCMPQCKENLMSMLDMAKNGCTILMSHKLPSLVKVWNARGQVVETCVENNIPWALLRPITQGELGEHGESTHKSYASKLKGFTLTFWHHILAHTDKGVVKQMANIVDNMVIMHDKDSCDDKECIGCHLAKPKKSHFNRNPERAASIGRLHMDYKSTKVPSIYYGNTGYFLMWDEASGVTMCIPTNTKRAKAQLVAFKYFEAELNKHGHSIYEINCDGGGEYVAHECMDYWKLVKKYSVNITGPYTPQHNSRAERKIQTLDNKLNACLQQYQLGDNYWELALFFTVYVENRIISTHRPLIPPLQALTGKKVSYTKLTMPFGTFVYCLRMDRSKSESRKAHPGLFVGFSQDHPKCILAHVPALHRIATVTHYVPDYNITTKVHRAKFDWYGLHNWIGELPTDAVGIGETESSSDADIGVSATPVKSNPPPSTMVHGGPIPFPFADDVQSREATSPPIGKRAVQESSVVLETNHGIDFENSDNVLETNPVDFENDWNLDVLETNHGITPAIISNNTGVYGLGNE
jgi:hypothetical protein